MAKTTQLIWKGLFALVILAGAGWFVFQAIFSSSFSGELRHDFGVVPIDRPFSVLEHISADKRVRPNLTFDQRNTLMWVHNDRVAEGASGQWRRVGDPNTSHVASESISKFENPLGI